MNYGFCEKCGELVQDPQQPAFPVVGWEVLRSAGGANAIRLRQRLPNRVRHAECLPSQSDTQASLFDSTAR